MKIPQKKIKYGCVTFILIIMAGYPFLIGSAREEPYLNLAIIIDRIAGFGLPAELDQALIGRIGTMSADLAGLLYDSVTVLASDHLVKNVILASEGMDSAANKEEIESLRKFKPEIDDDVNFNKTIFEESPIFDGIKYNIIKKIKENYAIFKAKDPNIQMTLFLPRDLGPLQDKGFNRDAFEKIDKNEFLSQYLGLYRTEADIEKIKQPLNIDKFAQLFTAPSGVKKRIVIDGHGAPGEIAQLNKTQYQQLVKVLNKINTEIGYATSCHSGGINMETFHDWTNREKELYAKGFSQSEYKELLKDIPSFIIIMSSTNENIVKGRGFAPNQEGAQWNKSFDEFGNYFSGKCGEKCLIAATKFIDKNDPGNIPSIRYPGKDTFFNASYIRGGKIETITWFKKQVKVLEPKLPGASKLSLTISQDVETLLVYPALLNIPIKFETAKPFGIYSMTPGNAIHMIKSLNAPQLAQTDLFASFFALQSVGRKNYVFLIKKLSAKRVSGSGFEGDDIENVLAYTSETGYGVCGKLNGQYYCAEHFTNNPEHWRNIQFIKKNKDEAKTLYKNAIDRAWPMEAGVARASKGQESLKAVKDKITNYLQKQGLY